MEAHLAAQRRFSDDKRGHILTRWQDLQSQRSKWMQQWEDISRFVAPFSGRFSLTDHADNRDLSHILDSEASQDLNILASGLMSGASSPARPWFSFAPVDPDLQDDHEVAVWCDQVRLLVLKCMQKSNTYNTLHQMYKELALFGIAADIIYDDYSTGIKHQCLTAGEFAVATNPSGEIDTLYRDFELTVAQAVKLFGYDNLSQDIRACYDNGYLDKYFAFLHAIEPRQDRDPKALEFAVNFPWASYYLELGTSAEGIVRESGFKEFPCIVPRWEIQGNNAYGFSPSMLCLPDIKQLQIESLRKGELVDAMTQPPLQIPTSARQNPISLNPGALNFTASTAPDQTIKPLVSGIGDLNAIREDIAELKQAIRRGFFVDLFMMVQQTAGDRRTTVEINALQQEQMLTLGPVVERNQVECLAPLVMLVYHRLLDAGALPPMPDVMQGSEPEIEFQSVLASAQKAVDVNTMDRAFQAIAAGAQVIPEVLDRVDPDGFVDEYTARLGVAPTMFRSKEQAEEIRAQRAQQQQAMMQQAQQSQQVQDLATLAQAAKGGADASLASQQMDEVAGGMPL